MSLNTFEKIVYYLNLFALCGAILNNIYIYYNYNPKDGDCINKNYFDYIFKINMLFIILVLCIFYIMYIKQYFNYVLVLFINIIYIILVTIIIFINFKCNNNTTNIFLSSFFNMIIFILMLSTIVYILAIVIGGRYKPRQRVKEGTVHTVYKSTFANVDNIDTLPTMKIKPKKTGLVEKKTPKGITVTDYSRGSIIIKPQDIPEDAFSPHNREENIKERFHEYNLVTTNQGWTNYLKKKIFWN